MILHKNLESAEFTDKKHGKPTLHSLIAHHVLRMSVKLKFQRVHFEKKHCFALVVLKWFPVCFYQGMFTRCDLYHTIILHCYAETNEMIYESGNLKGVVYKPTQNCFSLQSIITCQRRAIMTYNFLSPPNRFKPREFKVVDSCQGFCKVPL